ncbi:MAG: four helix bundle protein [Tannerella sp.]|jgi:four helix bundle protein|nr:four helix bundle protein [Tannerella sp.]
MEKEKEKTHRFEDLLVWQKAHQFVLDVYRKTKAFPKEELFGLTTQYRRAAVSIAANIAEGYGKKGGNDKLRFYNISEGSINECRYYVILSRDLNYVDMTDSLRMYEDLTDVHKLLHRYARHLKDNLSSNY